MYLYSGVIKRQGSPPHPLSGFIQAQITHSQKMQNFQPPVHVPYPQQSAQVHPVSQERYAGYQHGQGQGSIIANSQVHVKLSLALNQDNLGNLTSDDGNTNETSIEKLR